MAALRCGVVVFRKNTVLETQMYTIAVHIRSTAKGPPKGTSVRDHLCSTARYRQISYQLTSAARVVAQPPEASTTTISASIVTITATAATTTTNVQNTTITITFYAPEAIAYAQCGSDNTIDAVNGVYTVLLQDDPLAYTGGQDPVSCCNSCAATTSCTGFF